MLDRLRSTYASTSDITGRPAAEIGAWLTGWDLVPPGLVDVDAWRPGRDWHWLAPPQPASSPPPATRHPPPAARRPPPANAAYRDAALA